MDPLPFPREIVLVIDHFRHQPPYVEPLDAHDRDQFGLAVRPRQIDLRLPRPGDVDTHRFMVSRNESRGRGE